MELRQRLIWSGRHGREDIDIRDADRPMVASSDSSAAKRAGREFLPLQLIAMKRFRCWRVEAKRLWAAQPVSALRSPYALI
ncbi:MAG: hypothetical protein ACLQBA_18410 [Candidatus Binataceae bacterium]